LNWQGEERIVEHLVILALLHLTQGITFAIVQDTCSP